MSHEKSITVERDGRYYVLDNSGKDKGKILGSQKGYATKKTANTYARARSKSFDGPKRRGSLGAVLPYMKKK